MNHVHHPHGGDEGNAPIGRKKLRPLGVILYLEGEVKKMNKYSDNLIICHRS
jgi:ribosomal protein L2